MQVVVTISVADFNALEALLLRKTSYSINRNNRVNSFSEGETSNSSIRGRRTHKEFIRKTSHYQKSLIKEEDSNYLVNFMQAFEEAFGKLHNI